MRKLYAFLVLCFITYSAVAQKYVRASEWTRYRKEVFISLGSSNFLGDLGGGSKDGRDYSPADLDISETRTAFGFGGRYKVKRWMNVAGKFNYLILKGDDAKTDNIYRNNRNLNFKSNTFELTARAEFGYQSSRTGGTRYGIKKNYSAASKIFTHNFFGFIGLGAFYYNPKGKDASGNWVGLHALHTEGQGLPGGPKQYKRFSICIPVGAFYKLNISKKWTIGIEFTWRKTFTDYIDDVGSSYYDPAALEAAYGPKSAAMADPSLAKNNPDSPLYGASRPSADGTTAQRGDKQKDSYMSLEITAGYIFKQKRKSARLRSKF
jgi:hypothetical protein